MTVRATLYDADGTDQTVELTTGVASKLGKRQLLWVDVDGREPKAIERIGKALHLPEDATRHLSEPPSSARLLRYPGLVHLRVVAIQPVGSENGQSLGARRAAIETAPIDVLGAPNLVVTLHGGTVQAFREFVDEFRGDSHLGELDTAGFMGALIDSILSVWLQVIETIERRIDALDEQALRGGQPNSFLAEVVALRRRIAEMRRTLAPHRVAFAPLARPDFEIPELGRPWPGLVERLERTIDATQSARDLLLGSFDVYMARAAHRTNNVMKVLTVLNAVLLPAIVLAGVMGMNFQIRFFDEAANFWLVLGGMVAMATVIIGVSRWRGWI